MIILFYISVFWPDIWRLEAAESHILSIWILCSYSRVQSAFTYFYNILYIYNYLWLTRWPLWRWLVLSAGAVASKLVLKIRPQDCHLPHHNVDESDDWDSHNYDNSQNILCYISCCPNVVPQMEWIRLKSGGRLAAAYHFHSALYPENRRRRLPRTITSHVWLRQLVHTP